VEHSGIEWTDNTFNGWVGCTKVSPACQQCYAATIALRFGHVKNWGRDRKYLSDHNWKKPISWNKKSSTESGRRTRVFCASMSDIFEKHGKVLPEWRDRLWALIENTPQLDWQLLTKRPENILSMVPKEWAFDGFPPNVWVGTTVESQEWALKRLPILMEIPARIRFISAEPLIGPLDLTPWLVAPEADDHLRIKGRDDGIQWVIAGGEQAAEARPMHPAWLRTIRDDCQRFEVPLFFKQWGTFSSFDIVDNGHGSPIHRLPVAFRGRKRHQITPSASAIFLPCEIPFAQHAAYRIGGAVAIRAKLDITGRSLDGQEISQFPKTPFEANSADSSAA